ncbi:MAG: site-specific integrase [Oscillospiraceae bacterium]|nr:site-specific integrase [Oscillospiraceae bacterium]
MPSYEKNKSSGLWSCRFREINEVGETHQKRLSGFKTKKDAQYAYEEYIKEADEREAAKKAAEEEKKRAPNEMLFADLYEAFKAYKVQRVKPSTFYDMDKKTSERILPFFSSFKIKDITPARVLEWQTSISSFSYNYQKNLFGFLTAIFSFGEKYHGIVNVTKDIDRPRNLEAKKEMQIWSPEEFSHAIQTERSPIYALLFTFLYTVGCRRGEALALGWSDINYADGTAKITKSVTFKSAKKAEGDRYELTTPKNKGSIRTVTVPPFLLEQLRDAQKNASGAFIFGGDSPLPATTIDRHLTACATKGGVKRIRVHDLRHSCASYLIHSGVSIVAVSRQLGHTDIEQTLNTYSHLLPDDREQMRNNLQALGEKIGM